MDFPKLRETRVFTSPRAQPEGKYSRELTEVLDKSFSPMTDIVFFYFLGEIFMQKFDDLFLCGGENVL